MYTIYGCIYIYINIYCIYYIYMYYITTQANHSSFLSTCSWSNDTAVVAKSVKTTPQEEAKGGVGNWEA